LNLVLKFFIKIPVNHFVMYIFQFI